MAHEAYGLAPVTAWNIRGLTELKFSRDLYCPIAPNFTNSSILEVTVFEIYTDGSCNVVSKTGSWHFVILKEGNIIHEDGCLVESTTSNRMEYTASIESLRYLRHSFGPCEYLLRSDSQLLVNTVMTWMHHWKSHNWKKGKTSKISTIKNLDLVKDLYVLFSFHKGAFHWIKGHSGIEWNEYCDEKCTEIMEKFNENCFRNYKREYVANSNTTFPKVCKKETNYKQMEEQLEMSSLSLGEDN